MLGRSGHRQVSLRAWETQDLLAGLPICRVMYMPQRVQEAILLPGGNKGCMLHFFTLERDIQGLGNHQELRSPVPLGVASLPALVTCTPASNITLSFSPNG